MNRLQFIEQTYRDKTIPLDIIIDFFDHLMAAYTAIQNKNNIYVSGSTDTAHSFLKMIIFCMTGTIRSISILQDIIVYINNTLSNSIYIYGKVFDIDTQLSENSVDLFVRERT